MKDYSKGKIYWIKSNQTDLVYIGSTIAELDKRFRRHKIELKQYKKGKSNKCCSYELLENYDDCYIELIENYSCNNRKELERKEGEIQRQYKNIVVNKYIAGRTDKEYYRDNANKNKDYKRQYRLEHRERNKEYQKQYRLKNKAEKELIKHLEIISLL